MNPTRILGSLFSAAAAVAVGALVAFTPTPAQALTLTQAGADCTAPANNAGGPAQDDAFLAGTWASPFKGCGVTGLTLLYKGNRGTGSASGLEEGTFTPYYTTTFLPDGRSFQLNWDGPQAITCPTCWLVVKDGQASPNWYGFNLTTLSWNGTEAINMVNVFGDRFQVSHVSIWGKAGQVCERDCGPSGGKVPEPGTLALLGLGMALGGLGLRRRKA